jgi:hypothetical protein
MRQENRKNADPGSDEGSDEECQSAMRQRIPKNVEEPRVPIGDPTKHESPDLTEAAPDLANASTDLKPGIRGKRTGVSEWRMTSQSRTISKQHVPVQMRGNGL